ncbi:MAG: S-layer homology domain-containing protein [Lachnospiraceae bacterium]|nr:S-layer homology domain-containing protein [Lachnospiraceae bacterium]
MSAVHVFAIETEDAPSVNAGTVAVAALDIVAAYMEINAEDVSSLESLQSDILNWIEGYESLSQEDQALLSESMRYVQAIAAEIEDLQDAANAVSRGGDIDLEEDGAENSWRYLNGEPITDVFEVISDEVQSVPGWETDADIPYSSQEESDYSDDGIAIIQETDAFDDIVGSGVTYQGIDVSKHQGYIDWQQVKNAGIDFAIIRCGYGRNTASQDDVRWEYNAKSCESLGIPYGVYLYSHADNTSEIDGEVQHVLRLLKGHKPTLPVYIDIEENRQFALGGAVLSGFAERFCSQIKKAGYKSGLYTSTSHWNAYFGAFAELPSYYHWVAQYNTSCTYSGRYETWQYSNTGRVSGISGNVDRDVWYGRLDGSAPGKVSFSDVTDPKHPYYKAIYWAADAGITKGYSDGTFGIDKACTRSEAVMFLWRLAGKPAPSDATSNPFSDVPKSHAHYKAILWAAQKGITKGYGDGTFGINKTCTRGQIMTFIWRFKGQPAPKAASKSPFSDVPKNHAYYKAILWGSQNKVTNGFSDGTFGINKSCTRGQIVTFLYRIR